MDNKMILIPVQYGENGYTNGIKSNIKEVSAHFDIKSIDVEDESYSLHTEYCFEKRNFGFAKLENFNEIYSSARNEIPQLWFSDKWASEFADYIIKFTEGKKPPTIIEIHPPYARYYDNSIQEFIKNYTIFEEKIKIKFPDVIILLENRNSDSYKKKNNNEIRTKDFLISSIDQLNKLSSEIDKTGISLKIALDIPQLFTDHGILKSNTKEVDFNYEKDLIDKVFKDISKIKKNILSIHLWGKSYSGKRFNAHMGDLNTYFKENYQLKKHFLNKLKETFSDDIPRFFVPEVNNGIGYINSIIDDLNSIECIFEKYNY